MRRGVWFVRYMDDILVLTPTRGPTWRRVRRPERLRSWTICRPPAGQPFGPDAYVFGDPIGRRVRSVRAAWKTACQKARLRDFQLRDLRHEAGSRFDEAGVPTNYVSKMLGHRSLSTTSRYLNITRRGLHLAMQKLEQSRENREPVTSSLQERDRTPLVGPASSDRDRSQKSSVS